MSKLLCPKCMTWTDDRRGHRHCPGTPERQRQDRIFLIGFGMFFVVAVYALFTF